MSVPTSLFAALGVAPELLLALTEAGYTVPTPVQTAVIPAVLFGKDVLGIAPTGTGKTVGYMVPILQRILEERWLLPDRHVPVLVLVPTRELAVQVEEVIRSMAAKLPDRIHTMAAHGGVSINPQMIGMHGVNILVATPGRLLDLIEHKAVHLAHVRLLVLDEADRMLDLGFKEEMDQVLALLPRKRQNLLFSATLSHTVNDMTRSVLHKPEVVQVEVGHQEVVLIQQRAFRVSPERKGPYLRHLITTREMDQVLVFTSSSHSADHVADKLRKHGIDARATHGKKSDHARKEALAAFKTGKLRVLVTTDLLARGIDIAFLPYVINYELPRSPKDFIHRIGRTGRAEHPGEAFTLVTPEDQHHFKVIQKKMGQWLTLESTDDEVLVG